MHMCVKYFDFGKSIITVLFHISDMKYRIHCMFMTHMDENCVVFRH